MSPANIGTTNGHANMSLIILQSLMLLFLFTLKLSIIFFNKKQQIINFKGCGCKFLPNDVVLLIIIM